MEYFLNTIVASFKKLSVIVKYVFIQETNKYNIISEIISYWFCLFMDLMRTVIQKQQENQRKHEHTIMFFFQMWTFFDHMQWDCIEEVNLYTYIYTYI